MNAPKIVHRNENVRVVVRTSAALFEEGKDDEGKYAGGKWGGLYLRAPDIYFRILEKAGGKLVRLGDVAEVRFGIKTGANEFFYLEPLELTVKEVAELGEREPKAPVRVRNGAGWEGEIEAAWLQPLVKGFKEIERPRLRLDDLRRTVFLPPGEVRARITRGDENPLADYPKAASYIEWGRAKGFPEKATLASRNRWWDLGERSIAPVLVSAKIGDRYLVALNDAKALEDKVIYGVTPHAHTDDAEMLAAWMNSQLARLQVELGARQLTGAQAIADVDVRVWKEVLVPDPRLWKQSVSAREAFRVFSAQKVPNLFEELGFPRCRNKTCKHPEHPLENVDPERLDIARMREFAPKRFALERAVFSALGLEETDVLEVYRFILELAKTRILKARNKPNP